MKLTRPTGYYSKNGEAIHEGDGFLYKDGRYIHMDRYFKYPKNYDPKRKFGSAFYDKEKREWWIIFTDNPDLNIKLKNVEGVYQKEKNDKLK